jgi:hypothetical protein
MAKQTSDRPMVVGIAWFDRAQWQRLTEVVPDRTELDDTYEQWEENALKTIQTIERGGQRVERVHVNVETLMSWCKARSLPLDGPSRAQYVSIVLQQRNGRAEA